MRNVPAFVFTYLLFTVSTGATHRSIPLQHQRDKSSTTVRTLNAISRRTARLSGRDVQLAPMDFGPHDWFYGSFDVGDSKDLSLSIDTASGTLYLNSELYQPSNESINLNRSGESGFGTWFANGCGSGNFHYGNVYKDTVGIGGVVVHNQSFGILERNPPEYDLPPFPRDGIMGMSVGTDFTGYAPLGWFDKLCDQQQLEECRFGMALGTAGTGQFIFGGVDEDLYDGELTPVGSPHRGGNVSAPWVVNVVVNGTKTVIPSLKIGLFDSGTANIVVPPKDAKTVFTALGMQIEEVAPGTWGNCTASYTGGPIVLGYYPCDHPPTVGLQILTSKGGNTTGPVFRIEPEAFELANNGANNCTAVIVGMPSEKEEWNVGNAWMQGKYTDYTAWGVLQGVATLKDKSLGAGSVLVKTSASDNMRPRHFALVFGIVIALGWPSVI